MYETTLVIHSWFRWLVLASLLFAIYRAYLGWLTDRVFTKFDDTVRHTTATAAHIQLVFGVWLYLISPIVVALLNDFSEGLHIRELRFFGLEHPLTMLVAVSIITLGSILAKRKEHDKDKFKTMALWYTTAVVFIFISIPWEFSPIVGRPYFRLF